jgi:long-chain fatty acid transport protein
MRKSHLRLPFCAKSAFGYFVCSLLFSFSYSEGIQINFQSARFAAMGHSGVGVAKDASCLYFNPAAAAMLYGNEIQFGSGYNKAYTNYKAASPSVYSSLMENLPQTPAYLYSNFQPKRGGRVSFGLAITTPFGTSVKWENDWKGRFIVQENLFNTFCIQPSMAFRINEHFAVGAGFMYYVGDLQFQKAIPQTQIEGKEGWMSLKGQGNGKGINFGLHYRMNERFSVGLSYRSAVNWQIKTGKANFDVPLSISILYPNSSFSTQIYLPSQLSLGVSFVPVPKVLLILNIVQNGWHKFDSTAFDFKDTLLQDILYKRDFRNNLQISGGAEFRFLQACFFRMGAFYYLSPFKDDFVTPEIPDANKIGLTLGLGCNIKNAFSIDVTGQYDFTGDRTAQFKQVNFAGTYTSNGYKVGASVKYRF